MTWLKTYNQTTGVASGRINLDQALWFEVAQSGANFGVNAMMSITSASASLRLVTPGLPYATAADAVAAIDDLILNGS